MNRDTSWMLDGTCRQVDPEMWFPVSDNQKARRICAECPVRRQCLDYALANGEQEGIWGGTSANQRRRMPGWTPKQAYSDYRRAS